MTAPSRTDGWDRGLTLVTPSAIVIIVVVLTNGLLGPILAGFVYLLLTLGILVGIYTSARNWNIDYTVGFVVSALIFFIIVPNVVSSIVHPIFGFLSKLIFVFFLIGIGLLLISKLGIDEILNEL